MTEERDPVISRDEVYRRVPTLECIASPEIREEVRRATRYAPEYFWTRPGSYSGYHNGHRHGLWLHTLKLSRAIDVLAPSRQEMGVLTDKDVDRAHAAAILHDQRKNGPDPESDQTDSNHPAVMATIVEKDTDLDEVIAQAIHEHMGGFDDEPYPRSSVAKLVHDADMLAAADTIGIGVYKPIPEELQEHVYQEVDIEESYNG